MDVEDTLSRSYRKYYLAVKNQPYPNTVCICFQFAFHILLPQTTIF